MRVFRIGRYEIRNCTMPCHPQDSTVRVQVLPSMFNHYHDVLMHCDDKNEKSNSGFISDEVLNHFHVGLGDRSYGKLLPSSRTAEGQAIRASLQRLGVLNFTGHETFSGCLVIPIVIKKALVAIYAERIAPAQRGKPFAYWVLYQSPIVFNESHCVGHTQIHISPSAIMTLKRCAIGEYDTIAIPPYQQVGKNTLDTLLSFGAQQFGVLDCNGKSHCECLFCTPNQAIVSMLEKVQHNEL